MNVHLNVISELVGGFVVPGKAIPMNMFKAYGCMALLNAQQFAEDLKLGHYAKISPRSMFRAQVISCLLSVSVVSSLAPLHSLLMCLVVVGPELAAR